MPRVATAHDVSGRITVSLFQEIATHPQQHFTDFPIPVDSDMIVIGGGGRGDETIGALLTASYPKRDLTAWLVSSKDHMDVNPHHLLGFALGMKISGMSRDELCNAIGVFTQTSDLAPHPEATIVLPNNFMLLGGGFQIFWRGAGNLATASFPSPADEWTGWTARSKDHMDADPGFITTYALGIQQYLPVGTIRLHVQCATSPVVPHPRSTAVLPNGLVVTGGGAEVHWMGVGNLLWGLEPHGAGFTAASKDHCLSDPSSLTTYVLGIQLEVSLQSERKW
jgi:hypothetical protein